MNEPHQTVGQRTQYGYWPTAAVLLAISGLIILALPSRWEGAALLSISPGHALSTLDTIGVVPLVLGMCWIHIGLWRRRQRLANWVGSQPYMATASIFVAGFGLGALLASAFSSFFWWWALGAAVLAAAHVVAVRAALQ